MPPACEKPLVSTKICPVCKNEFAGGEVFCPNDGGRLVNASQMQLAEKSDPGDALLGTEVDLVTRGGLKERDAHILDEAVPL